MSALLQCYIEITFLLDGFVHSECSWWLLVVCYFFFPSDVYENKVCMQQTFE